MSKRPADEPIGGVAKQSKIEEASAPHVIGTAHCPHRHLLISQTAAPVAPAAPVKTKFIPPRRDQKRAFIYYKELEPLQGLQAVFENSSTDPNAKFAEVIIPADFMSTNNRRVKTRQLWGDGTYTSDSDIVAVLMHLGYYSNYLSYPPGPVQEFRALLKLLPSQEKYPSKARFVKSRTWASKTHTCAYIVESCWAVMKGGPGHLVELHSQLDEIPAICPTARAAVQRQINTRKSGGKSGTEVSVQFNLCNEPWLKYTLPAIADRGLKAPQWTSSRFQEEVLMLETDSQRFQVAKTGETTSPDGTSRDVFSLSRCKRPLPLGMMLKAGLPLPADHVEVIESALGWEEFQWGIGALAVKGTTLNLRRMQFLNRV